MKILAFSDVHCDHAACEALVAAAGQADLIIGAGDFAQRREGLSETMAILEPFADKAIFVAGNNETPEELRTATSAEVLHGQMTTRLGLNIYGLGGAIPELNITAFESFDITEAQAVPLLKAAAGADIMICHSPPKGVADVMATRGSMGSVEIRNTITHVQPKLMLCGHVHDCWGERGKIGQTEVANLGPNVNWIELEL
ncbi:MAG TPA: serine/threonine protein phosphatase [Rhodobacteraceae bacterium]|nr:serine/threonine protein phosphatase [Paracoccaceae bacterium]